jgi:outer membrane protein TolC
MAQSPTETVAGPTQAAKVPLSGKQTQTDPVMLTQRTSEGRSATSVNVIDSTVMVQGPYAGSVASARIKEGVIQLTLFDALSMGLRMNLGAITQSASVQQAKGQQDVARSALLPQLNTGISEQFERLNLRTQGVETQSFPESVKFNYYDARVRLQQSVFDLVRIHNLHGASETLQANIKAARDSRDLIVLGVGGSYLQLMATQARVDAAAAQVEVARAIAKQADDRLQAGLATRVDAMRAQVQMQTEAQRLRSLQADRDTQKLKLARLIGLAAGQAFTPVDDYTYAPQIDYTLDSAIALAMKARSDLQAAVSGVKAATAATKAAHAERYPSVAVEGTFGATGVTPTHESTGVYTVAGTVTIPIYEGGRIRGDIVQAQAALKQRKAEYEDLRGQVDEDVRQAFIDMNSAEDQVGVAKSNVDLSHATLTQSRDRFAAGVTDTVEVVQAEQAVVQADDDYITAVYEHNLAKVALSRAMGNAEQILPRLLQRK